MPRKRLPQDPRPTGAELADRLDAWCLATGASRVRVGIRLFNSMQGVYVLRKTIRPMRATVAKVEAFLADPPAPEHLPKRATPRVLAPKVNPHPNHYRDPVKAMQHADRVRKGIRRTAQRALDAGIPPHLASPNAGVRGAMKELAENAESKRRMECPVEQAKLIIRSRGTRCFDAYVTLGEAKGRGKYFINNRLVDEAELLDYASRLRSR